VNVPVAVYTEFMPVWGCDDKDIPMTKVCLEASHLRRGRVPFYSDVAPYEGLWFAAVVAVDGDLAGGLSFAAHPFIRSTE